MAKSPIRILPDLLGAMALMITVKVGVLWHDVAVTAGTEALAQTQPSQPPAPAQANPVAKPPATTPPAQPASNAPQTTPPPAAAPQTAQAPATPAAQPATAAQP